ncbi:diguanylate cyclase [Saccharibacillus sp. VR-M41]|uniref:Diguanylate cyclase n=2 Tax=Saccharibacillus alkalitolerans TaxID=2705290 RepID=A0ABX0F2C0_9BACL|nr:diguanylate cyclase [Saccharibacillus alkalitolerans]
MLQDLLRGKKFVGSNLIRVNILFMIIFALNVIFGFGYMAHSVRADYQKVRQAADLRIQLLMLENALIDQETGQRGFLLTGDVQFLESFDEGVQKYAKVAAGLSNGSEGVKEYPDLQEKVAALIEEGIKWKTEYGDPQVRKIVAGGTITKTELLSGKQQFDTFRAAEEDTLKIVEKLRDDRRAVMLRNLYYLFGAVGAIFIVVQFIMLFYLQKGLTRITRPIIQLDEAVASYEAGNIHSGLPAYREDNEIGRLVGSFGMMHEEMAREKVILKETYRMINVLNQTRSIEEAYRVTLDSIRSLVPCDRVSVITQNEKYGFSIKALFEHDSFTRQDIPLGGEEGDVYDLLRGGFSMIHADWSQYRAKGVITDKLYENGIRSSMHIILRKEVRIFGVLNLMSSGRNAFSQQDKERLELLAPMIVTALENATETTRIREMALHDSLTGLWNRRHFDHSLEMLADKYGQSERDNPFSLILLDVDRFKLFNDTWGHPEGDLVLKHLAKRLEDCVGPGDIPVRFGGEEFAVLLPGTRLEEARLTAERIREKLESESPSRKYKITASFGVAEWGTGLDRQGLIEAADQALYQAKESGRNRVCVHRPGKGGELA